MFNRLSILLAAAALVASVNVYALVVRQSDFCDTTPIYCCDNITTPTSDAAMKVAAKVGASLADVQGPVGLSCSPMSGIGVGDNGGECLQNPLCCFNNTWGGLITVGCSPISISL